MDKKLQNYKILSFNSGKPVMKKFYDVSETQIRYEFNKLARIDQMFPVAILNKKNDIVIWNKYFELQEVHKLVDSTFKELI